MPPASPAGSVSASPKSAGVTTYARTSPWRSSATWVSATGLDPIEKASRDELQALQLQRMKWSLKHAYDNVPHYRKKYDAAGVHPDDLKQLSDLAKFPFTTKLDLRDTYPYGMFATPMRDIVRIHA